MAHRIICIGRQNGAGGHIIGEALAKKLGIAFYDKNLISLAAERSGLSAELIEHGEEVLGITGGEHKLPPQCRRESNSLLYICHEGIVKDFLPHPAAFAPGK